MMPVVNPALVNYGHDLSLTQRSQLLEFPDGTFRLVTAIDLSTDMAEVDGRTGLLEALLRRITTYPGTLCDDPDYGYDVRLALNDDMSARDVAMVAARTAAEIAKDARVKSCSATGTFAGGVLVLDIAVQDGAGPFRLTLSVNDVSVQIMRVR